MAKYPVLPEARAWVRDHAPGLEPLATDLVYARVRGRAEERVREAVEYGFLQPSPLVSPLQQEMELLAFPTARLLVRVVNDAWLAKRWSGAEAKRMAAFLAQDPLEATEAVANALGVPFEGSGEEEPRFRLHFADYLLLAPFGRAWKLVARGLERGHVELDRAGFTGLLESALRERLAADTEGIVEVPREARKGLAPSVERLRVLVAEARARFEGPAITGAEPGLFPPCMTKILNDMAARVNAPHAARFAIVAFLHHLGMSSDDILEFFAATPNFSVEKSRYQIEHITGKTSPTEYSPPSCATMQSNAVCPLELRDALCFRIKHPLSYYEARWKQRAQQQPPAPEAKPTAPGPPPAKEATA